MEIQLTIAINFISSIDNNEEHVIPVKKKNNSESVKVSEFVFVYVPLLNYKCHEINPNLGGSYIDSPN